MIHSRPLSVWKQLRRVLSIQSACHLGEPDYENLYAFNASSRMRLGPESPTLGIGESGKYSKSLGRVTQVLPHAAPFLMCSPTPHRPPGCRGPH